MPNDIYTLDVVLGNDAIALVVVALLDPVETASVVLPGPEGIVTVDALIEGGGLSGAPGPPGPPGPQGPAGPSDDDGGYF